MTALHHTNAEEYEILIVEDNRSLCKLLEASVTKLGYRATCIDCAEGALEILQEKIFDLILLDVLLPEMNGIELCHQIRHFSDVPIIAISALSHSCDVVEMLGAGADEYITKPMRFICLEAIVFAQLRRYRGKNGGEQVPHYLRVGHLNLDMTTRTARIGESSVQLSSQEYNVLAYLMKRPGRPIALAEIYKDVWGAHVVDGEKAVAVTVHRLRNKLGRKLAQSDLIRTERGFGYKFVAPSKKGASHLS